jgi:hypothetical protein
MLFGTETLEQARINRPLTWNTTFTYEQVADNFKRYAEMKQDFLGGRITARQVIGTGYKNPKKVALEWINGRLDDALAQMRELEPFLHAPEFDL